MAREVFNYEALVAGEIYGVASVPVAAGVAVAKGDLLECVVSNGAPAATFTKPAGVAKTTNIYAIAAENAEAGEGVKKVTVYTNGYFGKTAVKFGGATTADENEIALIAHGIYLKEVH